MLQFIWFLWVWRSTSNYLCMPNVFWKASYKVMLWRVFYFTARNKSLIKEAHDKERKWREILLNISQLCGIWQLIAGTMASKLSYFTCSVSWQMEAWKDTLWQEKKRWREITNSTRLLFSCKWSFFQFLMNTVSSKILLYLNICWNVWLAI